MQFKILLAITIFQLLTGRPATTQPRPAAETGLYAEGLARSESGNWQEALQLWREAGDSLGNSAEVDPRLGIAFIRLATEHKAQEHYTAACETYLNGLSNTRSGAYKEAVKEEIERLAVLMPAEVSSQWLQLLDDNRKELSLRIRSFWMRHDPIPTSAVNERLLEHWQRIAYAREHFTQDDNTVFATDDRGLAYVKFGAPDRHFRGQLGVNQLESMRWVNDFLLRQEIQRFNSMPECEIWLYNDLVKDRTTSFIFGKKSGYGRYGIRFGVEDFISEAAFRRTSTKTTRGILPGSFLQLIYYRDLIDVDRFYFDRYRDLEVRWVNARAGGQISPDHSMLRGLVSHYKSIDTKNTSFEFLPPESTHTLEGIEKLYLNYKVFRRLSPDGQPQMAVFVVSSNQPIDANFAEPFFEPASKTRFKHRHVLISYSDDWQILDRVVQYPALENYTTSVFFLPHHTASRFAVVAEKMILDVRKAELHESDIPDTAKVIGIASAFLEENAPLSADSEAFEVTDLIVGQKTPAALAESYPHSFPVVPVDPVRPSQVKVFLQIFNLRLSSKMRANYRLYCEVTAAKNKGKADKKREYLKKSMDFDIAETTTDSAFDLNLTDLDPGPYRLTVTIIDKNANKKKVRQSSFRIRGIQSR